MITRSRSFMQSGEPSRSMVQSCILEFKKDLPRRERLKLYYDGQPPPILQRSKTDNLSNNKLVHNYPRYITTMAAGYLSGHPVAYSAPKGNEAALEAVTDQYKRGNVDTVDSELATNASIYGVAPELTYANEEARPRSATLDPRMAFVVYDDTVEHRPMFGVHYFPITTENGTKIGYSVTVYTATRITTYKAGRIESLHKTEPDARADHAFGDVPLVEYWNSDTEQGDFEGVISLIDAYNTLESDRLNDKEQFVDAILALCGFTMEEDAEGRSPAQQIKEDRMLILPDMNASANYITKQLDESSVEMLRTDINADIHKMAMIPDMSDDKFAGNVSGVAMRYKLFAFEQLTKMKERWFAEGLRTRLKLYANFMGTLASPTLDVEEVQLTFERSLPVNELEIAQMVSALQGIVPDQILLKKVPFVEDVEIAMQQLKAQKQEAAAENAKLFGVPDQGYATGGDDNGDDDETENAK